MVTYADEDVPFEHKHIISHSAGSIEGRESDELVTALFAHPDFRPLAEQAGMVVHKGLVVPPPCGAEPCGHQGHPARPAARPPW